MTIPTAGRWQVTTASGSVYLLDLDASTMERRPSDDANDLRKDGTVVPLVQVAVLAVGEPMALIIDVRGDGVLTVRYTTPVVAIEEVKVEVDAVGG